MASGSIKNFQKNLNFPSIFDFSCFLVDNGSLRADPTLNLRKVGIRLGGYLGIPVHPVSLLHSSKVCEKELEGFRAQLLRESLDRFLSFPHPSNILILPFFFGPSKALTEYIPGILNECKDFSNSSQIRLADCLISREDDSSKKIASIFKEKIQDIALSIDGIPQVALVDHGSAVEGVNAARTLVSNQLSELLSNSFQYLGSCSMENPSDSKFMSPLLADLLDTASHDHPLILVQMFLSNGRHAGPDGDVARICQSSGHPCIHITEPVLDHSMIIELLAKRAYEALP